MNKIIWTKKDGTEIDIKYMSKDHLQNTINMLKSQIDTLLDNQVFDPNGITRNDCIINRKQKWIDILNIELKSRK